MLGSSDHLEERPLSNWDTTFPPLLHKLHQLEFDYDDGDGYDFEPYQSFFPAEENASWFKAWTGNAAIDGSQFRVFGQDGTGGYAAFWLVLPDQPIEKQPVVFLGSEGEKGVVALSLDEYLWLLADGVGPYEAVAYPSPDSKPNAQFTLFAQENSGIAKLSAAEVLARANEAYPSFSEQIDSLCR
ncbi:hypothetical protein ABB30_06330 [Stenotrophomonas ginsengisoli]|uniref:Uncharacterized protein n=1 Tax=Stenotrophomonas ginsengisoli TaxID=336566 RepID=A0A0R0D7Y1_9GAMM|nr:hypothetical protein ABB30_06330 [Stenotrophomonas ginsengisoli]